ncbi:MAG: type II secretion system GspH family protein, partial [Candidatus Gastranaerophilales bacterium]|nr:type II secretion system GspH family protein [Candidatus Gastranaerophilales bacterium]
MIKFLKTTLYNPLRHFSADLLLSSSQRRKILLRSKRGNTLSETMIAMVILGVVFTISMGTFIADYNKNQTVVRLQKIYSVIQQAINLAVTHNGSADTWNFPESLSENGTYYVFEKYFKPNLVLARDCKNSTEGDCDYNFKELDGTEKSLNSTWSRFYLNDGAFIALQAISSNDYKVIYFYVDTNGKK